jgi:hypothetical protein
VIAVLIRRRRLAACALALLVCQTAAVFAAPLWSCCPSRHATAAAEQTDEHDCCPAGSHPPGQCPRHAGDSKAASRAACRMQCDAPHGVQFLIAAVGVMPAPQASVSTLSPGQFVSALALVPTLRASVPHSPPPRVR